MKTLDTDEALFAPLILDRCEPPIILLDVGAAIGRFTDGLRAFCGPDLNVIAHLFEPRPDAITALRTRYSDDYLTTVNGLAVGDHKGTVPFCMLPSGEHAHVAMLNRDLDESEEITKVVAVRMTTVDAYMLQYDIPHAILKIDTEGYELAVLRGARHSLAKRRILAIQFEYGGTWATHSRLAEARDLLPNFDFYEYDRLVGLIPTVSFEDDYTRSGNYLAVLKEKE